MILESDSSIENEKIRKIEETNVYGILYIPKLDSLFNPIYRIPSIWNWIPYPVLCSILLSIVYLDLIPIGFGLGRFQ